MDNIDYNMKIYDVQNVCSLKVVESIPPFSNLNFREAFIFFQPILKIMLNYLCLQTSEVLSTLYQIASKMTKF